MADEYQGAATGQQRPPPQSTSQGNMEYRIIRTESALEHMKEGFKRIESAIIQQNKNLNLISRAVVKTSQLQQDVTGLRGKVKELRDEIASHRAKSVEEGTKVVELINQATLNQKDLSSAIKSVDDRTADYETVKGKSTYNSIIMTGILFLAGVATTAIVGTVVTLIFSSITGTPTP